MTPIQKRKIGGSISISIVSCGIYCFYWAYMIVKSVRELKGSKGSCIGEYLCLLFVPFYSLYWWYTRGKYVHDLFVEKGLPTKSSGIKYLILGLFFLQIVSVGIMQTDFNSLPETPEKSNKIDTFVNKHSTGLVYMAFGVLTTVCAMGVYEATFLIAKHGLGVDLTDIDSVPYLVTYFTAQVLQWVTAVLVAFYTNRRWVFTDADRSRGTFWPQLIKFSISRLATFGLDIVLTYVFVLLLALFMKDAQLVIRISSLSLKINAEFIAKCIASIIVVIANWFISKIFVFKKPTATDESADAVNEKTDV